MSDGPPRSKRGVKRKRDTGKAEAPPVPVPVPAPAPESRRSGTGTGTGTGAGTGDRIPKVATRPGWTVPHPEVLPRPTFWPAALAFAVTFLLWGIVTSPIITAVGGLLLALSLTGWIGDIRNERSH